MIPKKMVEGEEMDTEEDIKVVINHNASIMAISLTDNMNFPTL